MSYGVCECWRLTPDGIHGSRACPFYGMHWSEVAAAQDRATDRARRQSDTDQSGRPARIEAVTRDLLADIEHHKNQEDT